MDKFIAISVGLGDAFYLQRGETRILVDGGASVNGFSTQFTRVTGQSGVNILVCTHNDSDHANGIIGFLRDGLGAEEVWLPGEWTDRLQDLLQRPDEFYSEAIEFFQSLLKDNPEIRRIDEIHPDTFRQPNQRREAGRPEVSTESLTQFLEEPNDSRFLTLGRWRRPFVRYPLYLHPLIADVIAAGERIREIAILAYHRGSRIRWLEFSEDKPASVFSPVLQPLNAREILSYSPKGWSAALFLYLTVVNRESLVFKSPSTSKAPSVLFCADSNFEFRQYVSWEDDMLITVPHHGSDSNINVYNRLQLEAGHVRPVWVRSDGKVHRNPCNQYLKTPFSARYCTICARVPTDKQDVIVLGHSGKWTSSSRQCACPMAV